MYVHVCLCLYSKMLTLKKYYDLYSIKISCVPTQRLLRNTVVPCSLIMFAQESIYCSRKYLTFLPLIYDFVSVLFAIVKKLDINE